jgi:hypothetical protein
MQDIKKTTKPWLQYLFSFTTEQSVMTYNHFIVWKINYQLAVDMIDIVTLLTGMVLISGTFLTVFVMAA